ncbi:NAD(P)H-binding protein [Paenibacillus sp. GSMTC-2017]|uniref:NAD(P)H-binding protein n=1 Tax=Paenibacillus sp. GSMTC-2017 TaxID=2794350 RepID=UPI0018D97E17|nr:NAD(P)H-binding protein [Paenibacillus sp. GSMTC-2017]MBH5318785.1 NAD(P)H-binding protein [Paenibacillus sp. GSMTC-2017]
MTILVTGATGNVGRHIVNQLVQAGQHVRALSRNPEKANLPEGVEIVKGDLSSPETLNHALVGVTGIHLITFNGEGFGALQTGAEIVGLAEKAGVKRVTVLWNGEPGPVERAIEASNLEWTFLEPVEFMSNTHEWAESIRSEGIVRDPFGDSLSALIHEADIASVAVAALIEGGHANKAYTLTGSEVLSVADRVRIISEVIGRDIDFVRLTVEEGRERMRARGAQEDVIDFVIGWHANPPESAYTVVPNVEQVTGRPARTFAEWVKEHEQNFKRA